MSNSGSHSGTRDLQERMEGNRGRQRIRVQLSAVFVLAGRAQRAGRRRCCRIRTPSAGDVPLGLYLHIPFCRKRCKFCYFRVYTDRNSSEIQLYLDALAREVENFSGLPRIAGRSLQFVYFGGGTPSYISVKHLNALVNRLKAVMPWDDAEEVAFECEPGTLSQPKVEAIREIGVTRLSLGPGESE